MGAAIGREFPHALLAAVVRKSEAELQSALDRLIAASLLFRQGLPPHATYLFKHALVRDAAYGTLLRGTRQELHGRIVSVLRQDFPELSVSQPELFAQHCAEGGLIPDAIEYYLSASGRATAASNIIEASAHLKRAMTLLEQLPPSEPRRAKLLSLIGSGGWWWTS
jgi:predicted ATPase